MNAIVLLPSSLRHVKRTVPASMRASKISTAPARGQFVTAPVSELPLTSNTTVHPVVHQDRVSERQVPATGCCAAAVVTRTGAPSSTPAVITARVRAHRDGVNMGINLVPALTRPALRSV